MSPILSIVVGATLLTVITIAYGGTFVLRATTGGYPFNGLQKTFFRAGHAHAGCSSSSGSCVRSHRHPQELREAGSGERSAFSPRRSWFRRGSSCR